MALVLIKRSLYSYFPTYTIWKFSGDYLVLATIPAGGDGDCGGTMGDAKTA